MLFSTVTSSALASVLTFGVVIAGRFSDVFRNMRDVLPGVPTWVTEGLYAVIPNFRNFDFKDRVTYGDPVAGDVLLWVTVYAAGLHRPRPRAGPRLVPVPGLPVTRSLAWRCSSWCPAVPWSQARIDERLGSFRAQEEVLYLWSGEHVRRLFPGFEGLAADIYWLRTVQYFGGERVFSPGPAVRAAPAPRRHHHYPRPAAGGGVPLRGHLPLRAPAERGRSPGPGHRAAREGRAKPARVLAAATGPGLLPLPLRRGRPPGGGGPRGGGGSARCRVLVADAGCGPDATGR